MSAGTRGRAVDVAIVGGGVMGASLATWLRTFDPTVSVALIERDPTWSQASSSLSAASIRQQYTTRVNIEISQQSLALLRSASEWLAVGEDRPSVNLHEGGYLYLASAQSEAVLREAHALQRSMQVDVALLSRGDLAAQFPWLNVSDLSLGSLGLSGEGWFDGYRLLTALNAKARALGAQLVRGEVVGLLQQRYRVTGLQLADGQTLAATAVVNAAGPWARSVAAMAGVPLPVDACRRTVFVLECPTPLPRFPLLIDTTGFWIRPDGVQYIGGIVPADDAADLPLEPDLDSFETEFWPALAHRVPAFESLRVARAWAGYYEMNTFDHNGIVGAHPDLRNFYFMNGFSGHGIQQAPAVGRALAERMLFGEYRSLDLSALEYERLTENRPVTERAIIG
jgi:hypothetical protein